MYKKYWDETRWFLSKAISFVLVVAIIVYLLLFLLNDYSKDFISTFFNLKIPLIVAVVSGFIYLITLKASLNENHA